MKPFLITVNTVIFLLSFTEAIEPDVPVLYFSNISNIQYYNESGSNTQVVFDNLDYGEALECNLCDHMIYWIDLPGMIKRGNPSNLSTVETIIDRDLHNPHGLAVDWISNNIYFSHMRAEGHGRIEVAKCDGSHRKVLKHKLRSVGVMAANPFTGHLYYNHDLTTISRIHLDGSAEEVVIDDFTFYEVSGMAVDHRLNILYWATNYTSSNVIKYLNMTEWDLVNDQGHTHPPAVEISANSNPYEISIINSILYWTELRLVNPTEGTVVRPGAIYSMNREDNNTTMLLQSHDLSPHDLCSFYGGNQVPADGCAINNGGCQIFCFSVPNTEGEGTQVQCGCPTGIIIKPDNTCNVYPQNYLIFTQLHNHENSFDIDRTDIRIMSLDISGQFIDTLLPIELPGSETVFVAYDLIHLRLYWTQLDPPAIMSAYLIDGGDVTVFINSSISHPESLVIDSYGRNLYWIDSGLDKIEVVRLENNRVRKVLFNSDLSHPQGLALDFMNGYMYWTDLDSHTPRVERAHMDGSDRMVLPGVNGAEIKQPSNVAVDPLTGQVYWSDVNTEKIIRYAGEQEHSLGITGLRDVLGLAVHGNYIYWTDRGNRQQSLARARKTTGYPQEPILRDISGFYGLIAVNSSHYPGASVCEHVPLSANQLCLPSGNSTAPTITCIDHFVLDLINGQCKDTPPVIFIATGEGVLQFRYTMEVIENGEFVQEFEISNALALEFDIVENKLYWINTLEKRIYRQSINDTESNGPECVVCCCLGSPDDVAVDWYGRNLYWTDSKLGVIEISKLDGSERSIFAIIREDLGAPSFINVDPVRGKLYWSPKSQAVVYEMKMADLTADLSPEINILWQNLDLSEKNWTVAGIALNYSISDGQYDYIYWAVTNEEFTKIYRKNLVYPQIGGEIHNFPGKVSDIKSYGGTVYYEQKQVFRDSIVNAQTGNHVTTAGYSGRINDFVIMHHSLQPGNHECSVNNGGCGGNSLCLVADGVTGMCSCPTLLVTSKGQQLGATFHDCIAVNTFLLLATNDTISYLPVPVDHSSTSAHPRRLSIGSVGQIKTLAYDPANKSVVWIDSMTNNVRSVAIDGSEEWDFSIPHGLDPFSMAYDWFGGQMFVTETSGFQIELLTLNGGSVGSLLKLSDNPLHINKPREVVLDDINSYLYWTSDSTDGGYGEALYRMSLKNSNDATRLNISNRKIEKLVHDPPFLYWLNKGKENDVVIERYNLSSSISNPEVSVIARFANDITALTATTINDVPNVFWYNETDNFIYRHNGTIGLRYMIWHVPSAIIGFLSYTRKDLLQSRPCLASPRPCSHLCLRNTIMKYQCGCPPNSDDLINGTFCSGHRCSALQLSCGDEFNGCYPRAYRCDGINHCRNGADEMNCICKNQQYTCFNTTSECIALSQRCDGTVDCQEGEDEKFCCEEPSFGCYVNASALSDPYGGTGNLQRYKCLEMGLRCDRTSDCADGSDEIDCPTSSTSDNPQQTNGPIEVPTLIVISVAVVLMFMVVLLVGVFITVRWVHKKKQEYYMSQTMIRANNVSMGACKGQSPPLPSESQSDYCSEMSGGTHTTQLGNGSNMSPSGDTSFKYRTADPPPPSPDALTEIEDDDLSRLSQPISEYTVPVPPCPSINYDALSGNMSFSVSQSQFPGAITSHYNGMYNQRVGRNVGNLPNPLLMHQQNGNAYYHSNRAPQAQHIFPHFSKNTHMPNGNHDRYYPPAPHYHQNVYSRKELDSVAQSETGSTLSMNTENPPDVFDENLPRPPPGRPPSPATLCSEYPGVQLMLPETESTLSESSDDC